MGFDGLDGMVLALALVIEIMVLRRSRRSASDRVRAMRADAKQP